MAGLGDIRRLLDAFEKSDWDEIHLVMDGFEVHVAAGDVTISPVAALPTGSAAAPATPAVAPASAPSPSAAPAAPAAAPPPAAEDIQMEGAHAVVSPSPGIFWRSPAPGEPPFVEVGQTVEPDTPIGIVEVMKLMNQVLAGVSGTVRAVLVENGARVERDEPLVLVDPS